MYSMLETVHNLSQSLSQPSTTTKVVYQQLTQFLTTLTPLCSSHPTLFAPHLQAILSFLPQLILPQVDSGLTPTVSRLTASRRSAFEFPPRGSSSPATDPEVDEEAEARSTMRLTTLEFMISLSEARPAMVRKHASWVGVIVRACLEGMSELDEDEDLSVWLKDDVNICIFRLRQDLLTGELALAFFWHRRRLTTCPLRTIARSHCLCTWRTGRSSSRV
jgi:hypothetical protein